MQLDDEYRSQITKITGSACNMDNVLFTLSITLERTSNYLVIKNGAIRLFVTLEFNVSYAIYSLELYCERKRKLNRLFRLIIYAVVNVIKVP